MTNGFARDGPTVQADPCAEYHVDVGPEVQDRTKRPDGRQGSREVGVPVAHIIGPIVEGSKEALADSLGLAGILSQVADQEAFASFAMQLVEQISGFRPCSRR